jgi:hypothetical protein
MGLSGVLALWLSRYSLSVVALLIVLPALWALQAAAEMMNTSASAVILNLFAFFMENSLVCYAA